jgi:glycosyltransferase involved in cell wall biosynthesis
LAAWRGSKKDRRSADVVHVELGKLDLTCFWYAVLAVISGACVTVTAHDAPTLALHPSAGLLPQRHRAARTLTYRVLAPLLDKRLERYLVSRLAAVGVLSPEAASTWPADGRPSVLVSMRLGADRRGTQGPPSESRIVLTAGFLGPSKGTDVLLEAWALLGDGSGFQLHIVGDTTDSTHRLWVEQLRRQAAGLPNPPTWLGAVSEEGWLEVFRRAAIVVLPYRVSSPASGPLVRALTEGRAIVMSDVQAAGPLLVDDENALIVPVGDEVALGEALRRLIEDPALMDRLGRCAEATVSGDVGWLEHAKGLNELLLAAASRDLAGSGRSRASAESSPPGQRDSEPVGP